MRYPHSIDDELYVKRLQKRHKYKLISDNKSYDDRARGRKL
ncbi:hypothetical protein [Helicobacter bilis]|nr:hypothetical protein [Helicobacter bilis]MDY4399029.1 hypothetical protein [Helicobacter bilis]